MPVDIYKRLHPYNPERLRLNSLRLAKKIESKLAIRLILIKLKTSFPVLSETEQQQFILFDNLLFKQIKFLQVRYDTSYRYTSNFWNYHNSEHTLELLEKLVDFWCNLAQVDSNLSFSQIIPNLLGALYHDAIIIPKLLRIRAASHADDFKEIEFAQINSSVIKREQRNVSESESRSYFYAMKQIKNESNRLFGHDGLSEIQFGKLKASILNTEVALISGHVGHPLIDYKSSLSDIVVPVFDLYAQYADKPIVYSSRYQLESLIKPTLSLHKKSDKFHPAHTIIFQQSIAFSRYQTPFIKGLITEWESKIGPALQISIDTNNQEANIDTNNQEAKKYVSNFSGRILDDLNEALITMRKLREYRLGRFYTPRLVQQDPQDPQKTRVYLPKANIFQDFMQHLDACAAGKFTVEDLKHIILPELEPQTIVNLS